MPAESPTKPVEDSVAKVNDEIAVGSDLNFQRQWWRFEIIVWSVFTLLVVLSLFGVFGRGYVAKGHVAAADGSIDVRYERIERMGTPSVMTVQFSPNAGHDGKVQLWVAETLVKQLGAQRVVPQPSESAIGNGGITYTFPVSGSPQTVEFALQPTTAGRNELQLRTADGQLVAAPVFVMP